MLASMFADLASSETKKIALRLLSWLLIACVASSTASTNHARVLEFRSMVGWVRETGTPKILTHVSQIVDSSEPTMRVRAKVFEEPAANARHAFCLGATPQTEKFLFFIATDVGDKSATIWRVSSDGNLIATTCFAGGAAKSVPNAELAAGFLVEKEYFFRTFRHLQSPLELLVDPASPK